MKSPKLTRYFSFILLFFSASAAFGQVPISDGGIIEIDNCDIVVQLTDSDADDGNYLPNETHEITICFNTVLDNPLQFTIIPPNNEEDTIRVWDIDDESSLFVYEGVGTGGNQIGEFNSEIDPDGVFFTTNNSCLTFVFVSGSSSTGEGFIAQIGCVTGLQPFNANVIIDPPFGLSEEEFPQLEGENVITFCYSDTLSFTAVPTFPLSDATGNGYEQLAEECLYIWDMGDGTVEQGIGLTEFTYSYEQFGGHFATLTIIDVNGQVEVYSAYLLSAPRPIFSNIVFNDTLCLGDSTIITGGVLGLDTVGVSPNQSLVNLNYDFIGTDSLPDGSGVSYSTEIEIFGFADDPVITQPSDFIELCMNIEHSYLGDLDATLICPNGNSVLLFDGFNGPAAGQYLGEPIDNDLGNPGVGFDYCFNSDATQGTLMDELLGIPVAGGESMPAGTYLPEGNFDDLVGCPLNGTWTIEITDNLFIDDGYIFSWGVEFDDQFEIDTIFYGPSLTEIYWLPNEDIVVDNDTSITVLPSQPGNNAFTFVAEDSFGCIHDTTYFVYVRPFPALSDAIACDLTHTLAPTNSPAGGEYEVTTLPADTAQLNFLDISPFGVADVEATNYGVYTVLWTESNCGYQVDANIDFRPDPRIAPFVEDTVLCSGASIEFLAGPQEPNSQNFQPVWTLDGTTFNTSDLAVTVSESGQYIFTLSGVCGLVADTSDVLAIQIDFEGDTLCELDPRFISVDVEPESIGGEWSAPEGGGIFFTQPNSTTTQIIPDDYGDYLISYTDDRCPNDVVTRNFKFIRQPDIVILPEQPEFCYELDTLLLTAVVEGSTTGEFFWTIENINGDALPPQIDFDLNETQFFPEESFEPNQTYLLTAQTFDEFGVCPIVGQDSVVFTPLACVYAIPNVITPNGDNQNDIWVIENIEDFPGASLKIYNRWGNMVFDEPNYDRYQLVNGGWDPDDLKGGVYFFELKLPSIDRVENGNLTILTEGGSEQ